MNKTEKVRQHLLKNESITSWDAIQLYRATRLSGIIYNLKDDGFDIDSVWEENIDEDGNKSRYVKYVPLNKQDLLNKIKENP